MDESVGPACRRPSGAMTLQRVRGRPLQGSSLPHRSTLPGGSSRWPPSRALGGRVAQSGGAERGSGGGRECCWPGEAAGQQRQLPEVSWRRWRRLEAGQRQEIRGPQPGEATQSPTLTPQSRPGPRPEERARAATMAPLPGQTLPWLPPARTSSGRHLPVLCPAQTQACQPGGKPQQVPPARRPPPPETTLPPPAPPSQGLRYPQINSAFSFWVICPLPGLRVRGRAVLGAGLSPHPLPPAQGPGHTV